jgi:ABC-2 type transport system ATP-binding protein
MTAYASASPGHMRPEHFPVEMDHVKRRFGSVTAVSDVSLRVPAGSILGVIGPSGSGKTTTIRVILGTLAPDAGKVRVLGEDPRRFHRRTRERIGYMPQLFVLYPDLTARENVDFVAATFGLLWRRRRRRVREVLQLVDLWDARNRRASDMSGGMQRRLELCCALVHEPSLLVLDEPTAGVDPMLRQIIWAELDRLRRSGATIIVTTQYVTEAEYCDTVALISGGVLIAHASPDDVRRQALGGEVIEVLTSRPFDMRVLAPIEGVVEIRQTGPYQLLVIAADSARATPRVAAAIETAGGEVEASREYRPSFDEVFATLVNRHEAGGREGTSAGAVSPDMPVAMRRSR